MSAAPSARRPNLTAEPSVNLCAPGRLPIKASDLASPCERLTAAIQGLGALKRRCAVKLYTDSKYVLQGITEWLPQWKARGWRTAARAPVKNQDLWELLDAAVSEQDIEWHWVKGHSGHDGNEYVDQLANAAIDRMLSGQ